MIYLNKDFFKMCIGFLLIVGLGLVGVYLASREEEVPAATELTSEAK